MADRPRMWEVILEPGRARSIERQHPWVLSGAVARVVRGEDGVTGEPEAGAFVRVRSAEGQLVGHGHYSPQSSIRVRLLAFGKEPADDALLEVRIGEAIARREADPLLRGTDAVRLINAEADGLPGLIVDRYADIVVAKLLTAGMDARRDRIVAALRQCSGAERGYERGDGHAARREGLRARSGVLFGAAPTQPIPIDERGRRFEVDVVAGQKTGFYLDQRDARDLVERLSRERRVLDVFSYSGGFSVAAARGGATSLRLLDSSREALAAAERHLDLNEAGGPRLLEQGDAFEGMRGLAAGAERFDLLIIDPPPLARRQHDVQKASRAYKDLFLHGLRAAAPDAWLLVFTCSHHIDPPLFQKLVFGAALDAGRSVQLVGSLGAPSDHPVALAHPEGRYLHGLLLRVVGDAIDATATPTTRRDRHAEAAGRRRGGRRRRGR